ncbi:DUF2239 family protein [Gemmatimonas sp. UBA7669]|uniref:DUF2239 family protein n=1 Tax=Gemmatimonas sp. UBA7669 TaxID=1946568 RepID=UPI0025C30D4F|nr:DUF2239 family protein [Gemmatimonas sp. UBA7669]
MPDHADPAGGASVASYTAFRGSRRLAQGALREVAQMVYTHVQDAQTQSARAADAILLFDDRTGRVVDLEMRGTARAMLANLSARGLLPPSLPAPGVAAHNAAHDATRAAVPRADRGPGRPRLGVVAREVTLLPRHWEWLASQPGGASVALRKLVDAARKAQADVDAARARRDAAYAVMTALAGDRTHYEDATRALFRDDRAGLVAHMAKWPRDVQTYVLQVYDGPLTEVS